MGRCNADLTRRACMQVFIFHPDRCFSDPHSRCRFAYNNLSATATERPPFPPHRNELGRHSSRNSSRGDSPRRLKSTPYGRVLLRGEGPGSISLKPFALATAAHGEQASLQRPHAAHGTQTLLSGCLRGRWQSFFSLSDCHTWQSRFSSVAAAHGSFAPMFAVYCRGRATPRVGGDNDARSL